MYAPWNRLGEEGIEDGQRLPFTGSAQAIIDDGGAFEAAGLGTLLVNLEGTSVAETTERCEAFAEAVMR